MQPIISNPATALFALLLFNALRKTGANPTRNSIVVVPKGETVTLVCQSNDDNHNFFYWHVTEKDVIVGPSNYYDPGKFRYEVLSGNLTIRAVSKNEEGIYDCVSRGVRKDDLKIRSVRMMVQDDWEEVFEDDSNVNLFRVTVVLATLMVLGGVAYGGYRIWKNRYRNPTYLMPSDEDEEDSGDELFRAPGTSRSADTLTEPTPTSQRFEAPGISTDFTSILDTANNK